MPCLSSEPCVEVDHLPIVSEGLAIMGIPCHCSTKSIGEHSRHGARLALLPLDL